MVIADYNASITSIDLYINAAVVSTNNATHQIVDSVTFANLVGTDLITPDYYNGFLYDLKIYNIAKTGTLVTDSIGTFCTAPCSLCPLNGVCLSTCAWN